MMLYLEKAQQAHALLNEFDIDCWLTFVRETTDRPDPGIELVVGTNVTWPSAFLVGRGGERIAIVGRYDVENVNATGTFLNIVGYDQDMRSALLEALEHLGPQTIGLNFSLHTHTADGLTHGMFRQLQDMLNGTPYIARLLSAEEMLVRLRARKTPTEVARIRAAIATTQEIVAALTPQLRPGISETQIADLVHDQFRQHQVASAWDWEYCPTVNCGPESPIGHTVPQAHITLEPGHIVHIDLGVRQESYCSDLQRLWYMCRPGETAVPPAVQKGWDTVLRAIDAGAAALRPGVAGWEVDAVARKVITDAGYPEYKHSLGHGLGRSTHDGGPLLGPRWPRYGDAPYQQVEVGHVYTLELGVLTHAGMVSMEEVVVVTEDGCEYLSSPQREIVLI